MKKSKRAKASKTEHCVDMISNLPDPILELILSRLPINEVVRTSILSKRWRYLWKSIPSFPSLDMSSRRRKPLTKFEKKKFKEFVSWALINKSHQDLESFHLRCSNYYNTLTVGRWIHLAIKRKVKILNLMFCTISKNDLIELPNCLINCDSLESLKLVLFRRPFCLPDRAMFPALRVLELNNVYCFGLDIVEEFIESCPLLEDLSLIDCLMRKHYDLSISCSKLKTLRIHNLYIAKGNCNLVVSCPKLLVLEYVGEGPRAYVSFRNLYSLKKVVILPQDDNLQKTISSRLGTNICKLLAVNSHLESLSLNLYFITAFCTASNPEGNFCAFLLNLKTLELTTTIDAFTLNVLIRLLKCSPSLESLRLIIQEEFLWPEYWELDEVETRRILTRHLKRVEFLEFNGENQKLGIARFLLEHGNALEEMVFSWRDKVKYHEKSTETMNEVLKFHKASSTVKLIALLKDGREKLSV